MLEIKNINLLISTLTILVTGGVDYIGSHTVLSLQKKDMTLFF